MSKEISRREFIRYSLAGAIILASSHETVENAASWGKAREIHYPLYTVQMQGLQEPWWIVHATDFHPGGSGFLDVDHVDEDVCTQVGKEVARELDLIGSRRERTIIVATGDMLTARNGVYTSVEEYSLGIDNFCSEVPADLRVAVGGNHEHNHPEVAEIRRLSEKAGFEVLGWDASDRILMLSETLPFQFVGLPDYTTHPGCYGQDPHKFFADLDSKKPVLCLTHNATPFGSKRWRQTLEELETDVSIFAGHVHGGQIGGNTVLQLIGRRCAMGAIEYDAEFIEGIYKLSSRVSMCMCNGIGSAGIIPRTTDRQVNIFEVKRAV